MKPGHHALLYEDAGRFAGTVAAFAREGVHGGQRVLAALTPEKLGWLREELGADADEVDLVDADVLYAQHGPMFSRFLGFLDDHASRGDGSARIVAEQALGRRPPEAVRAYMHYEAAMTVACADRPVRVLCPYDTARPPASVVEDALRTHPNVRQDDRLRPNPLFTEPRAFVRDRVERRPPPPEAQPYALEQAEDIAGVRALVRREAERGALSTLGGRGPRARGQRDRRQRARARRGAAPGLGLLRRPRRRLSRPRRGPGTRRPARGRRAASRR